VPSVLVSAVSPEGCFSLLWVPNCHLLFSTPKLNGSLGFHTSTFSRKSSCFSQDGLACAFPGVSAPSSELHQLEVWGYNP
jgi:hypothetical protein